MKKYFSLLVVIVTMLSGAVAYAEFKPFTQAAFEEAKSAGKTVVVDFHASWCPSCKKQQPLLNEIVKNPGYEGVIGFTADFDNEVALKGSMGVTRQSTIIVFKGDSEVGRNTGSIDKVVLKALIDKGL